MRAALAAVAALVALFVAGCGFGIGGGSADDFRAEAQATCVDFDEKIGDIPSPANLTDLVESSGQIAELLEQQLEALADLDPPGSLSNEFEDWMRLNEEAIDNAREIQAAAEDQDEARIRELAGLAEQNERAADRLAHEMEIDECLIEEEEVTN